MKKKLRFLSILLACCIFSGCDFSLGGSGSTENGSSVVNPVDPTPDDSTPDDSTPDDSTPDNSTPDNSTPDDSMPDDSTPDDSTPDDSTPNGSTPNDSTPDDSTPDDNTPDDGKPEQPPVDGEPCTHKDDDSNLVCDWCYQSVLVCLDVFAVNDLHGKFVDSDTVTGVAGLTTYLKEQKAKNPNTIFLSSGDMWQGGPESNLTRGKIVDDWMGEMEFVSMTLGNHEFDWGTEYIAQNALTTKFPFLALNVYDRATNQRVEYCQPSVMVEVGGAKIGVIGAVGDCYSSISSDKVTDVYFKTGSQLTALVKEEANRLKAAGADCIIYSLHDGYGSSSSQSSISDSQLSSYYDTALSGGYVDVVFEGHSHQGYAMKDSGGVYHLQGGGDNSGISHATLQVNAVTGEVTTQKAEKISKSSYASKTPDPLVDTLLQKYADEIQKADDVLGQNAAYRNSNFICDLVADLYLQTGLERWGKDYNIVLGGGFLSLRSPYNLQAGQVIYSDLLTILPFDNQIVLCQISGRNLKSKFLETTNSRYYISCSDYGESIRNSVDVSKTYYVVVDTYTSQYSSNGLTEVARYDETTFARDLLAEYIRNGGLSK